MRSFRLPLLLLLALTAPLLAAAPEGAPCEWTLDDPEQALAVVERLQPLNALQALDWPQGQALRVDSRGTDALTLRVHTRQEWLALEGELAVDEELVLGLQQLDLYRLQ